MFTLGRFSTWLFWNYASKLTGAVGPNNEWTDTTIKLVEMKSDQFISWIKNCTPYQQHIVRDWANKSLEKCCLSPNNTYWYENLFAPARNASTGSPHHKGSKNRRSNDNEAASPKYHPLNVKIGSFVSVVHGKPKHCRKCVQPRRIVVSWKVHPELLSQICRVTPDH